MEADRVPSTSERTKVLQAESGEKQVQPARSVHPGPLCSTDGDNSAFGGKASVAFDCSGTKHLLLSLVRV